MSDSDKPEKVYLGTVEFLCYTEETLLRLRKALADTVRRETLTAPDMIQTTSCGARILYAEAATLQEIWAQRTEQAERDGIPTQVNDKMRTILRKRRAGEN